jgi:SAM-dependent methyltransferase
MRFETRYTQDFVERSLPSPCRRILEVGCGTGELAARLSKDGRAVVAIDSDAECVAAARSLGVDARVATWPDFDADRFDALLFSRSLHHIRPLDESIRRAANSLGDGGRVIVEDFAYESADEKTLHWFRSAIHSLEARGLLIINDEFASKVLSKAKTLDAWRENHAHDLHTSTEIDVQLEKIFSRVLRENAAYYFRYIANAINVTEKRNEILRAIAEQEKTLAADGRIVALGRRFVAVQTG